VYNLAVGSQRLSDGEFKLGRDFVDGGPFGQIRRPALKHNASVVVHDQANGSFRRVTSWLPDHFHHCGPARCYGAVKGTLNAADARDLATRDRPHLGGIERRNS
jgi:hypothetical protein